MVCHRSCSAGSELGREPYTGKLCAPLSKPSDPKASFTMIIRQCIVTSSSNTLEIMVKKGLPFVTHCYSFKVVT